MDLIKKFFNDGANTYLFIFLKAILVLLISVSLAWVLAIFWSSHGNWWLSIQTDSSRTLFYAIARPFLSSDAAIAEDQLDFWMFLIPSLMVVISIIGFIVFTWGKSFMTLTK